MTGPSWSLHRLMRVGGLLFTLASLGFAAVLLTRHGDELLRQWAELRAAGWGARPGWLALAFALGVSNLFLLGGAWIWLVRELGGALGYLEGMRIWTWTNLGRYLPGRLWQVSALGLYMRQAKQLGGIALGANIALQLLALASAAGLAFGVLGVRLAEGNSMMIAAAVLVASVGLVVILRPSMIGRLSHWMSERLGEPMSGAEPRRSVLWGATGLATVSWFVSGLGLLFLWKGIGGEVGPRLWFWTGSYAAAYLIGYAAVFAPAGLVVREGALAALLVGLGGVPAAAAAGIAVLSRLWAVASELGATAFAWILPRG